MIDATGAGGVTIKSVVANTGVLFAGKGNLTVLGAVTGAGTVRINGATADFASAFSQNVAFTGTTGVLELAKSQSYGGTITNFSKTGATSLDLTDIVFSATKTKASYSGTTKSGVLTVTDGAHTAHIKLVGNYTASTFKVSSDGHGGTTVVDPSKAAGPSVHPFIAAAAGFGAIGASEVLRAPEAWRPPPALASPRSLPA
jgi:hypothetical protein